VAQRRQRPGAGRRRRARAGRVRPPHIRDNLGAVETGTPDGFAAWDEAHCLWEAGVRPLAQEADAVTWHSVDETITADIDAALADGHDAIGGEPPNTTIDDWRIPPNKQRAEKSVFRAAQRVIVELAGKARADADPVAARRALELFGMLEDRLDGRNTPGIQQIKDILGGDPAMIDPLVRSSTSSTSPSPSAPATTPTRRSPATRSASRPATRAPSRATPTRCCWSPG
jgi:hypothetical protein